MTQSCVENDEVDSNENDSPAATVIDQSETGSNEVGNNTLYMFKFFTSQNTPTESDQTDRQQQANCVIMTPRKSSMGANGTVTKTKQRDDQGNWRLNRKTQ